MSSDPLNPRRPIRTPDGGTCDGCTRDCPLANLAPRAATAAAPPPPRPFDHELTPLGWLVVAIVVMLAAAWFWRLDFLSPLGAW